MRRSFSVDFHIVEFDELAYWNFRCWVFFFSLFLYDSSSPKKTQIFRIFLTIHQQLVIRPLLCINDAAVASTLYTTIFPFSRFYLEKKRKEKFFHRRRNNIITIAYWRAHNIIMPAYIIGLYVYGDDLSVLLYMIHTRRLLYRFCGNLLIFSVFFFFC